MARITWRTKEEIDAAREAQAWASLRAERDRRLAETDWTQFPDVPLTEEQRAAWQQYRQALRDVPQQPGAPFDVVWPDPPAHGYRSSSQLRSRICG